ncbi:NAD-dependent epimerase/dehydratase family protein [Umezawaea endophytica]|uniref:NAD-dependent epimerase/dehydratase family protein n=1 Tax=Umezawaea endophytica TaxID=1654476 RepID=UPI0023DE8280
MKITISGASGLIGGRLAARLRDRGDEVTVLSRSASTDLAAWRWDPLAGPAPVGALAGRDAVVHLAGEPIAQRLTDEVKDRVRRSRVDGTRNLVDGLRTTPEADRPRVLVSSSGVAYYGPRGDEEITEETPPGGTFLATVCAEWEEEAARAAEFGVRVVRMRTGVVLDASGGTPSRCSPPTGSAWAGRSRAARSPSRGSTSTTSSTCTPRRSTTRRGPAPTTAPRPNPSPSGSSPRHSAGPCAARPSCRRRGSRSSWRSARWPT